MKYRIRKAKFEDAKGIAKVHIKSWRETYKGIVDEEYLRNLDLEHRTNKWKEILEKPKPHSWTFVAVDEDEKVVGFISGGAAREKVAQYKGEMYAIYILKRAQGYKLGYRLTKRLCSILTKQGIKNMYVCVLRENNSKTFYTRYGAKFLKTKRLNIGKKTLPEEYYGWMNFGNFLK